MNHYVDILGGRKNLEMAVAVFYKMALLDPVISPYFRNKNTDQISSHFCDVVEACLGEERTRQGAISHRSQKHMANWSRNSASMMRSMIICCESLMPRSMR